MCKSVIVTLSCHTLVNPGEPAGHGANEVLLHTQVLPLDPKTAAQSADAYVSAACAISRCNTHITWHNAEQRLLHASPNYPLCFAECIQPESSGQI